MAHPTPLKDAGLLTFFGILAGIGLIGMFVLVMVRARLVRSLADLETNLEVQKMSGIDLRRRLEDANRLLKQERERARTALDRVEHLKSECDHTTEGLKHQVHQQEEHFHECEHNAAGERESFLHQEHELILEVEECRADVKDLYEDLKAAHLSVQQHEDIIEQWKRAYHAEADSHGNTAKELDQVIKDLDAHKAARAVPVRSYPASAAEGDLVMTHHPAHPAATQAQPVPQQPVPQQQPAPQARAPPPVRPADSTLEDDMVRAEAAVRRANAPVHHHVPPPAPGNPPRAQPPVPQPARQPVPQPARPPPPQPARQPVPQPARQPVPQPARQPAPQPVPPAGTRYPVEENFT